MPKSLINGSFRALKWSAVRGRRHCRAAHRPDRRAAHAASAAGLDLGRPRAPSTAAPCRRSSGSRPATAPRSAYRHYPARGAGDRACRDPRSRLVRVERAAIHALSDALAARGVETFAVDIRGHGASGTRGDIGYVGQLEDDLADFVAVVRKTEPTAPLTLIGHSAGGGFALRVAASPIQDLFARTVLLAPYLGYNAPTNRPNSGGWASADIPRVHRRWRRCAGSASTAATRCRRWPSRCRRIRRKS